MRAAAVVVLGLVAALGAAAAFAPASLVDGRLQTLTRGEVRLAAAEGTIWHGRGVAVIGADRALIPVEWRLEPLPLASGEARITLESTPGTSGAPHGRLVLAAADARVERLELALPAAAIAARIPVPGLRAGGTIAVRVEDLAIGERIDRGAVRVEWREARLASEVQPAVDLGTVTAVLSARDGALAGPLTGRGGSIRIDGETALGPRGARLVARLRPEPTAGATDRAALARLGAPAADGSVSIEVTGNAPR